MIPKIIHYCWFGRKEKPDLIKQCIESWKKYLPDYKIIEWNEDNFDVNSFQFTRTAYEKEKWAFVSDVARLTALIEYGGFYMDTDVEVLTKDPISKLIDFHNIFCFETERRIATGLFCGCEPNSDIFQKFLKCYESIDYIGDNSQLNTTFNFPIFLSEYTSLILNNETQIIDQTLFLSMKEYSKIMRHYALHTWLENQVDYQINWKDNIIRRTIRNPKIYQFLGKKNYKLMNAYEFLTYDLLDMGPLYFIKRRKKRKNNEKLD